MEKKEDTKKDIERISFFIDWSALRDMFNGDDKSKSKDLLKKLKELSDSGKEVTCVTSTANFLRAIWLSNPETSINNIQKTLTFLKIVVLSNVDFKNENQVLEETIKVAQMLSGGNTKK